MVRVRFTMLLAIAAMASGLAGVAVAQDFNKTFFTDYSKLQAKPVAKGTDFTYIPAGVLEKIAKYDSIMIDEPEVLIGAKSDYKGAKPADLAAISEAVRKAVGDQLTAGGYKVVDAPGPTVIYARIAVTDLNLKKKKRPLLAYTPAGFVLKAGLDSLKGMMDKYDILGMALQAELSDSQSSEVLAQTVALRGAGSDGKPVRIDFNEITGTITDFSSRLRCRLDNAHVPADKQIDCLDPAARKAREATKKAP